jgi:hypothetical protein
MLIFNPTSGYWVNTNKPGGRVFFVGGGTVAARGKTGTGIGASDDNDGQDPARPLSTISQAHTQCRAGAGDTIAVLPGTVTLTAGITISKADVTIMGVGDTAGATRAAVIANTLAASDDLIDVTGVGVTIDGLEFAASGAALTSRINAGAEGLTVRNCVFYCGANDLETITVPAAGTDLVVEDNEFHVTANGPDAAIEIEATGATRAVIRRNVFDGGSDTNAWDAGAINSGVAHTLCRVEDNVSNFGPAIIFSAAATGTISGNFVGEGTLGSMIDPGSCMCFENYEADAINETARIFPTTAAS